MTVSKERVVRVRDRRGQWLERNKAKTRRWQRDNKQEAAVRVRQGDDNDSGEQRECW
jgi:hypothetical protein